MIEFTNGSMALHSMRLFNQRLYMFKYDRLHERFNKFHIPLKTPQVFTLGKTGKQNPHLKVQSSQGDE